MQYKYIGCFFDPEGLWEKTKMIRTSPLENLIQNPHVTFLYRPEIVNESLFGSCVEVTITGYGCDGNNEGVLVNLKIDQKELIELAQGIPVPHITLSLSDNADAVNTRYIHFEPVEPITVQGIFGAMTEGNDIVLSADSISAIGDDEGVYF